MTKLKEKIRIFFLTNKLLRKIRNFFNQIFFPAFLKITLGFLALLLLAFILLKLFKPVYLDKIEQKSASYFFHYLKLDNGELAQIKVSGNKRVTTDEILKIAEEVNNDLSKNSDQYQPFIMSMVSAMKERLPWINKIVITRSMPNILNITVTEYEPFAIWQNDGKKYFTDKEGNLIPFEELEEFQHMVILSGKGANKNARSLFNIMAMDPELGNNIYSATWVSERRWDIRFENGLLIKLPESNISNAWQRLIKIYDMQGSLLGLKIIDLRIKDKTYLEYDDSVIKEIKKL
jgi:cell division protein FtsQ